MFNIEDNKEIIYNNKNGIEYIQFKKLLDLNIKHAYTLKNSELDFYSFSEKRKSSFEKLFKSLGLNLDTLVQPIQTHTDRVKCIDKIFELEELKDIDGLITDKKGITLATTNADCILFLFYDPIKKVIANVHSGWKGTFQKIAEKTVSKMITYYQCKPEEILCFICPSIRKCHFEVDEDVKILCENIFGFTNKLNDFIKKGDIKENKQKYFIDTVLINKILLKEIGLKEKNIIDCNLCSVCNSDKIASYRVEGKEFRRATAIISL